MKALRIIAIVSAIIMACVILIYVLSFIEPITKFFINELYFICNYWILGLLWFVSLTLLTFALFKLQKLGRKNPKRRWLIGGGIATLFIIPILIGSLSLFTLHIRYNIQFISDAVFTLGGKNGSAWFEIQGEKYKSLNSEDSSDLLKLSYYSRYLRIASYLYNDHEKSEYVKKKQIAIDYLIAGNKKYEDNNVIDALEDYKKAFYQSYLRGRDIEISDVFNNAAKNAPTDKLAAQIYREGTFAGLHLKNENLDKYLKAKYYARRGDIDMATQLLEQIIAKEKLWREIARADKDFKAVTIP